MNNDAIIRGLLPHPNETATDYALRCRRLIDSSAQMREHFRDEGDEPPVEQELLEQACACLHHYIGAAPDWICAIYSKQGMGSLHLGALATLEQPQLPIVQLHPRLRRSPSWWGYRAELVLAHEMIHGMREGFESEFEEFLAYGIDSSSLRRGLGPFFHKPSTACWTMVALIGATLGLGLEAADLSGYPLLVTCGALLLRLMAQFAARRTLWSRFHRRARALSKTQRNLLALLLDQHHLVELSRLPVERWGSWWAELPESPYRQALQPLLQKAQEPSSSSW